MHSEPDNAYCPALQLLHELDAGGDDSPAGQLGQLLAAGPDHVPALQLVHAAAPADDHCPALHVNRLALADPGCGQKYPALQLLHGDPGSENCPALQLTHAVGDVEATGDDVPAGQSVQKVAALDDHFPALHSIGF